MRGTARAQALRQSQTDAEAKLWCRLRDRRLGGFKFRRQVPLGPFIVDFLCNDVRLVVEVDGGQHADRANYDAQRTCFLESLGLKIVRYWNDDILLRTDEVLADLSMRLFAPRPGPLPAGGEREDRGA